MIVVAIFVFFLMLPRPLRSTLFPYTTLFRSCKVAVRQYRGVNVSATGGHLRVQLGIGDIGSRSGESNNCRVGIKFRRRWRLFTADKRQKIKERNILIGTGGGRWFGKLA